MAKSELRGIAHESIQWSIGLSVLMILLGVVALGWPLAAGVAVSAIVAWLLMLTGILHLGFAWHTSGAGGLLWEVLVGAVYLAIGVYLLRNPLAGLTSLTVVLAAYLVLKGFAEFGFAAAVRPLSGSGWLLFDGMVSVLLGVMIAAHLPSSTAWAVGTMVGVAILFSGISRLLLALAARKLLLRVV